MTTSPNIQFSPAVIRRNVYQLVFLITIIGTLTASYIFWATNKSSETLSQINAFHHNSQLQLSKAADAIYEIQLLLSSKYTRWQDLDHQQQTKFNIFLYRLSQSIDYTRQLQEKNPDKNFTPLNDLLWTQHTRFITTVDDFKQIIHNAESVFTDSQALLLTTEKLSRLHAVVHDEKLEWFHTQNRQQNTFFYTILFTLLVLAVIVTVRSLKVIDNIIIQHRQSEQELHQAREHEQELLVTQNEKLEQLVGERTQELRDAHDQLLRKSRLETLGKITGIVSHELRNPLGTISATLYSLRKRLEQHQPDQSRLFDRIDRSIHRCDLIVEELLVYSRSREVNLIVVDFDKWLNAILEDHELPAAIDVHCDTNAQTNTAIDTEHMRSAIINLLENASQSMINQDGKPVDGARLSVRTFEQDEKLICEIEDNGIGIPAETLDKIFEPLFTTKVYGVGLGMTIVQRTIEQHGGKLEVHSVQNKGTLCRIILDAAQE